MFLILVHLESLNDHDSTETGDLDHRCLTLFSENSSLFRFRIRVLYHVGIIKHSSVNAISYHKKKQPRLSRHYRML
jgi:hypothetical protein